MATTPSQQNSNLVPQVVAEWRERLLRGERFALDEYTSRYPEVAEELRELYPAVVMIEDLKGDIGDLTSSVGLGATLPNNGQTLERLGDFRILREVGRGGMGIVYEAEQESLGRHVALKVLPAQAMLRADQRKRFQREAKAAARMHHTNIVPVYGVGEHDGMCYYVMQFIQGLGLDSVLAELKKLRDARLGIQPLPADVPSDQAKSEAAADVAQSLLTGQFKAPDPAPREPAPSERAGAKEAAPLTESATADGLTPNEGMAEPSPICGRTIAANLGVLPAAPPPARPVGVASSAVHTVVVSDHGDKSTLTESGGHYWRSVARLALQVAEALDYAHQQGVLHRDIKPSNLLLDTQGTLWVTDFGLAKATTDGENLTHTGDIVGTLRYMAPERFNGVSDVRGDIYSLGLTLYELAVQRPAYEEKDKNRLIMQVMESAPPAPRKVNKTIPRDLDTIILKATDREPGRRYQTAHSVAEDLRRFIDDKPILARQASVVERLWRWSHRNPVVAGLSAATFVLLLALAVGSTFVALSFERMASEEKHLRVIADLNQARIKVLHGEAVANLEESERQKKLAEENFHKARFAVDTSLTKVSETKLLNVPGLQPLRKELLESALQFYEGFLKQRSDDPALQKDLAIAYAKVARITAEIGSKEKALDSYRQSLAIRNKLLGADPKNVELEAEIAAQHQAVGQLQLQVGELGESLKSFQEASKILRGVIPRGQDKSQLLARFAATQNAIGETYIQNGERLEAMSYFEAALKLQRELVKENPDHARIGEFRYELAIQINRTGELNRHIGLVTEAAKSHGEALKILTDLRAAAPPGELANDLQRAVATSHERIGDVHKANDRLHAAAVAYQEALPIRKRLATDNPAVIDYQSELAQTYFALATLQAGMGQADKSAESFQSAIERQRTAVAAAPQVAEHSRWLGRQLADLGQVQLRLAKPAEAQRFYEEAGTIFKGLSRPTADDLYDLARTRAACSHLVGQGKAELTPAEKEERKEHADQALATLRQALAGGFHDVERLRKAPEFADMRYLKDFQGLVTDMRQKSKGIPWNPDFEASKTLAVQEKKDLFVYFTGSDWCYWCLLVRNDVFGKEAFGAYSSKYFVPVELDFPKEKAKPKNYERNEALMEHWALDGFPSLILADAEGRPYASLRDGKGRETAAAYVELMEKLRKRREARDELLAKARASEGLEKAKTLDQALGLVDKEFWASGYADLVAQILQLDAEDKAGLRSKYLTAALVQRRGDIQEAMKKQDWDGTIVKIDKIIAELKPTGTVAAEVWIDRARAFAKLGQWDKAEADYDKALQLKPQDPVLRVERGQFFKDRGQPERAVKEFLAAIEPKLKAIESAREAFDFNPNDPETWRLLSEGYIKLGEIQRKAGRPADAMATALERTKVFPGSFLETYNAACELALCVPLFGNAAGEPSAAQKAQRQQYVDLAMDYLRNAVLLGAVDARHMKHDTDLDPLRGRADFKALERALEPSDRFPPIGNQSRLLKGHAKLLECVAFGSDSSRVLSSGYDNTVRLWDVKTGKEIQRLKGHKGLVHGMAFVGDGRRVVTAGSDGTVRIWDADTGKEVRRLLGHEGPVVAVAVSSDGKLILSGGADLILRLWNADTGAPIRQLRGHKAPISTLALAPDGRRALSGGHERAIFYWDVETGKPIHRLPSSENGRGGVALSPDGRRAISGSRTGLVSLWDLDKGSLIRRFDPTWDIMRGVGFAPDGRHVFTANVRTGVTAWDVDTGRAVYRLGAGVPCGDLAVAPNGSWLATASSDGPIHLWALTPDVVRARDLARTGQVDQAEAAYGALVKQRDGDPELRWERARFYARLGQWEKAIADYDRAIEGGLSDADIRLERGRCHGELGQWDKVTADFDAALAAFEGDPNGAVRVNTVCEEAVRWDKVFEQLSAARPKNPAFPLAQGRHLAKQGQWAPAAAAIARSVELQPPDDMLIWFHHACLRNLVGDAKGYEAVCARLLAQRDKKGSSITGYHMARIGTIAPNGVLDFTALEAGAEKDLNRGSKAYWGMELRGALAYRAGRYEQALAPLRECLLDFPKWEGQALSWLWLAMTQHQLGQTEEAVKSLAKADEWFAKNAKEMPAPPETPAPTARTKTAELVVPLTLSDWLHAHVLRREAEQLIRGSRTTAKR